MRVWLINEGENLPGDDNCPRLQRMGLLAFELSKIDGTEVVWWQSTFNHYQKKFRFLEDTTIQLKENLKLIMLHSCGYKRNVSLKRLCHELITARRFYTHSRKEPLPDILVVAMPTIAQAHYAVKYGRNYDIPVFVDLRDLNPDVFVSPFNGVIKQLVKIGIKPLQYMLGNALKHADGLIGTTEPYLDWGLKYAGRQRRANDRVFYVSYQDNGIVKELSEDSRWKKYQNYNGVICCFFGQFGRLVDLDTVIDAAEICQKNDVQAKFLLCGTGELLEYYRNKVKEKDLSNVDLPGWVNKSDIADIGILSDVGLMAYKNDDNFNMQMPNKFSEYLSLGLAILLQPSGVMERVIKDNGCGICYKTAIDLYNAIEMLADNRTRLEDYKQRSRALFEKAFSAEIVYKEYSEFIIKNIRN